VASATTFVPDPLPRGLLGDPRSFLDIALAWRRQPEDVRRLVALTDQGDRLVVTSQAPDAMLISAFGAQRGTASADAPVLGLSLLSSGGRLNLRERPARDAPVLATLTERSIVVALSDVASTDARWSEVAASEGAHGWVLASLVGRQERRCVPTLDGAHADWAIISHAGVNLYLFAKLRPATVVLARAVGCEATTLATWRESGSVLKEWFASTGGDGVLRVFVGTTENGSRDLAGIVRWRGLEPHETAMLVLWDEPFPTGAELPAAERVVLRGTATAGGLLIVRSPDRTERIIYAEGSDPTARAQTMETETVGESSAETSDEF